MSALVGLPTFGVLMFLAFYGDCFDNEQCHQGEGLRWTGAFLITAAIAACVGLLTRKLVNGWTRRRG